jgi:PPM family protein phosphatase
MRVAVGARTDVGRKRSRNDDNYLTHPPLFAVADGMGGHRAGNVASSLTLETLERVVSAAHDGRAALSGAIREANRAVYEMSGSVPEYRGMGTTVTAVIVGDRSIFVAHVGDSRAYLLREGSLQQVTDDHTLVRRLFLEHQITEDEAATHPSRGLLMRAVGVEPSVEPDELEIGVRDGDRILLCTDGLSEMIPVSSVRAILAFEASPQAACQQLVDAANEAGGEDNVTAVVLDLEDVPSEPRGSTRVLDGRPQAS